MSEEQYLYKVDGLTFETQEEYREYLASSEKYSNAYEPWTPELDDELWELVRSKGVSELALSELALHFQRRSGAIKSRLSRLNLEKGIIASKIIEAIIKGYNPHTGEIFEEDSMWSHPKIISDLQEWINED